MIIISIQAITDEVHLIANLITGIVEVEVIQRDRVICCGIVRSHLIVDNPVAQTLRQDLKGHTRIASHIQGLSHTQVDHGAAIDVHIALRAILIDVLRLNTLTGNIVDTPILGVVVLQTQVTCSVVSQSLRSIVHRVAIISQHTVGL